MRLSLKEIFKYKAEAIAYYKWGNGSKVIFCFHGFGLESKSFEQLNGHLNGNDYTVYSFDLFFHGDSKWSFGEKYLTADFLAEIFKGFVAQEQIREFSLVGFSIGGRIAMCLAQRFGKAVRELYLIAPDGICTATFYNLVTYPLFFRRLFRYTIKNPGLFLGLVSFLRKLKLVDPGLLRFANNEMRTEDQRRRVYNTWVTFSKLRPAHKKISEAIPMLIYTGAYDKVIRTKKIRRKLRDRENVELVELKASHSGLLEKSIKDLIKRLES